MDKEIQSISQLRVFVLQKDLKDHRNNIVEFSANVIFQMEDSTTALNLDVQILFKSGIKAGVVNFFGGNIDPEIYPMGHEAKWQNYRFINGTSLEITGGKKFGNYRIVVTPL